MRGGPEWLRAPEAEETLAWIEGLRAQPAQESELPRRRPSSGPRQRGGVLASRVEGSR